MKVTRSHVTETDASARTAVQRSICVPLVMPGVWVASVAGRRTEARGARLHVGAIASTRLIKVGSMWLTVQTTELLWRDTMRRCLVCNQLQRGENAHVTRALSPKQCFGMKIYGKRGQTIARQPAGE